MLSRRRRAHEEDHDNHERWLLTYADLITLLLALFMMLYAMSVLDIQKYQKFQEAFTKGMGGHPTQAKDIAPDSGDTTSSPPPSAAPVSTAHTLDLQDLKALKAKLEKELKAAGLQDEVQLDLQPRGLVINVVSAVLFDSGSATLSHRGDALLSALGSVFTTFDNNLVVEGHTDPRPIKSSAFPSNWELSTARATAVLRFLISDKHLAPTRLSAAGYADTRPRASNSTEAGMARNRRVDVVVLAAPAKAATPAKAAAVPSPAPSAKTAVHVAALHH